MAILKPLYYLTPATLDPRSIAQMKERYLKSLAKEFILNLAIWLALGADKLLFDRCIDTWAHSLVWTSDWVFRGFLTLCAGAVFICVTGLIPLWFFDFVRVGTQLRQIDRQISTNCHGFLELCEQHPEVRAFVDQIVASGRPLVDEDFRQAQMWLIEKPLREARSRDREAFRKLHGLSVNPQSEVQAR